MDKVEEISFEEDTQDLQHRLRGLSSRRAKQRLIRVCNKILETEIKKFKVRHFVRQWFKTLGIWLSILTIALLIVSLVFITTDFARVFFEVLILFVLLILNFRIGLRDYRHRMLSTAQRARAHLDAFLKNNDPLLDMTEEDQARQVTNSSVAYTRVRRNNRWTVIPTILLVRGDVIALSYGQTAPCHIRAAHQPDIQLKKGEVCHILPPSLESLFPPVRKVESEVNKSSQDSEKEWQCDWCPFFVLETVAKTELTDALRRISAQPSTPFSRFQHLLITIFNVIAITSLCISLISTSLRFFLTENLRRHWASEYLVHNAYLLLPLLPLSFSLLLDIIYSLQNARLLALFQIQQFGRESPSDREKSLSRSPSRSSQRTNQQQEGEENIHIVNEERRIHISRIRKHSVPSKLVRQYFGKLLFGQNETLSRYSKLIQILGNTTVLCLIDKEGIVTEPIPYAEKVCILEETPIQLELERKRTREIAFETENWQNYLPSLKPLGLNCMLNLSCIANRHKIKQKQQQQHIHTHMHEPVTQTTFFEHVPLFNEHNKCLCLLAKTIGFSENVLDHYLSLTEMQNYDFQTEKYLNNFTSEKSKNVTLPPQSMLSLVVQDLASENLQLLSRGSPLFVLERCTEYWDGQSLKLLTDAHRNSIKELFNQWSLVLDFHCIAFSYKPIEGKYKALFKDQGVLTSSERRDTDTSQSSYTDSTDTSTTTVSSESNEKSYELKKFRSRLEKRSYNKSAKEKSRDKIEKTERSKSTKHSEKMRESTPHKIPKAKTKPTVVSSAISRRFRAKRQIKSASYLEEEEEGEKNKHEMYFVHSRHDSAPETVENRHSSSLHPPRSLKERHQRDYSQASTASDRLTPEYSSDPVMSDPLPRRKPHTDKFDFKSDFSYISEKNEEGSQNDRILNKSKSPNRPDFRDDDVSLSFSDSHQEKQTKEQHDIKTKEETGPEKKDSTENTSHKPKKSRDRRQKSKTKKERSTKGKGGKDNNNNNIEEDKKLLNKETKTTETKVEEKMSNVMSTDNPNAESKNKQPPQTVTVTEQNTTETPQSSTDPLPPPTTTEETTIVSEKNQSTQTITESTENVKNVSIEQKERLIPSDHQLQESRGKEKEQNGTASQLLTSQTKSEKIDENSDYLIELRNSFQSICRDQTFLGMAAVRFLPKEEVPNFVEELDEAFIRFVYFSPANERKTKLFADRLGLDTGWNSCISLKEKDKSSNLETPTNTQSTANIIEKLPHGISHIRNHIATVDNVPLLVRIFCDTTPQTTKEMIQILQENGEVCIVVGSALQPLNIPIYARADLAISMIPSCSVLCSDLATPNPSDERETLPSNVEKTSTLNPPGNDRSSLEIPRNSVLSKQESTVPIPERPPRLSYSELSSANFADYCSSGSLAVDLNSMPCELIMRADSNFFDIYELIRMGRHLLRNTKQCLLFTFGAYIALHYLLLLNNVSMIPQILNGIQILWTMFVIIPCIAISILFNPMEKEIMRYIVPKNVPLKRNFVLRHVFMTFIRILPSVLVCLVVFVLVLWMTWENFTLDFVFGRDLPSTWETIDYLTALNFSQNVALFTFVFYLLFFSMSSLHRTLSIFSYNPFRNVPWIIACIVALGLQSAFFLAYTNSDLWLITKLEWYIYLIVFLWPIVILVINEAIKSIERRKHIIEQRILKLEFQTKLGMHSPDMDTDSSNTKKDLTNMKTESPDNKNEKP